MIHSKLTTALLEQQDFPETGKPFSVVAHHGSWHDFNGLDFAKARDGAHWFTTDESHALSFGPRLTTAELSFKNPLVITETDDLYSAWDREHPEGEQDDRGLLPRDFVSDFVDKAKAEGRDGLIIRDFGDRDVIITAYLPFSNDAISYKR